MTFINVAGTISRTRQNEEELTLSQTRFVMDPILSRVFRLEMRRMVRDLATQHRQRFSDWQLRLYCKYVEPDTRLRCSIQLFTEDKIFFTLVEDWDPVNAATLGVNNIDAQVRRHIEKHTTLAQFAEPRQKPEVDT